MSKWKKAKERLITCPCDYEINELEEFLSSIGFYKVNDDNLSPDYSFLYSRPERKIIAFPRQSPVNVCILKKLTETLRENGDI